MRKKSIALCLFIYFLSINTFAQLKELTVEKIMRDPVWIGQSPTGLQWSAEEDLLYFSWLKDAKEPDALYAISTQNTKPRRALQQEKNDLIYAWQITYNNNRTAYVYIKNGDVFFKNKNAKPLPVTNTIEAESNACFSFNESRIVYALNQNLFAWDIATGSTVQLTNFAKDPKTTKKITTPESNEQEEWLQNDQLQYFQILKERKTKKEFNTSYYKTIEIKKLREIAIKDKTLSDVSISPDGRYISYLLTERSAGKQTIVPNYVTESGFTEDIAARTKVGAAPATSDIFIYDRISDSIFLFDKKILPGINELPAFFNDYPAKLEAAKKAKLPLSIAVSGISWSPTGKWAVVEVESVNNKHRWLVKWNAADQNFAVLDHQHDEAWIGGPGVNLHTTGWVNDNLFWYQSEATGYTHLYITNLFTNNKQQLTHGKYEVRTMKLANDKKHFYILTNETHPGEQQLYKLEIASGKKQQITQFVGGYEIAISPDENYFAYLYSTANRPWELYLQNNPIVRAKIRAGKIEKITNQAISVEWASYPWPEPEYVSFQAADGATVYARLYKPLAPHATKPAVIFVHGAGYLQNAHKWWSSYFREYMFHNLLADKGYYVLDIDYRASAGYGRHWRTGIYRHMGGKDLSDNIDGASYLVKNFGVDAKRIGIYGGSYGGFIALMAMFTEPDKFAAAAALRPVTDWAQYNHGYTSNILNEPFTDSIAYRRSSPLYFAEGLKGKLLICHGMLDVNVHYQDVVKLSQRLIESGKNNWELASYPMEDHGFVEPTSWTDEYKRILKLFEEVLKK